MKLAEANALRRIAILGSGFEAMLAAAYLSRVVDTAKTAINIVATRCNDDIDRQYASLPLTPDDLLAACGISELELISNHASSYSLGIRLGQHIIPFGPVGLEFNGCAFHHHWRLNKNAQPYFAYSPAFVALQSHRFAPPIAHNAIGALQHEISRHVDPTSLTRQLCTAARKHDVEMTAAHLADVERDADDHITVLVCADGKRIPCDLVIDASGDDPTVHQVLTKTAWQTTGPALSLETLKHDSSEAPRPVTSVTTNNEGWQLAVPLSQAQISLSYSQSNHDATAWSLGFNKTPWQDNCVSIGARASRSLATLPWHATLLMRSIRRLVEFLPDRHTIATMRAVYNRQTSAEHEELHSMQQLILAWRATQLGEALQQTHALSGRMALWRKRGHWQQADATLFDDCHWINLLMALGEVPAAGDPLAEQTSDTERREQMSRLLQRITTVTNGFPTLSRYLSAARQTVHHQTAGQRA